VAPRLAAAFGDGRVATVFDEIAGLPAHPLLVHAAVMLAPMLALVAIAYAVLPVARVHTERLLAVLAVAAPLSVASARESGEAFRRRLVREGATTPDLLDQIDAHAASSRTLLLLTLALGAVAFGWLLLEGARARRRHSPTLVIVFAAVTCALGAAVLWAVVDTGHAGAAMVWAGV